MVIRKAREARGQMSGQVEQRAKDASETADDFEAAWQARLARRALSAIDRDDSGTAANILGEIYEIGGTEALFNSAYAWITVRILPIALELSDVELEEAFSPFFELPEDESDGFGVEVADAASTFVTAVLNDDVSGACLFWDTLPVEEQLSVSGLLLAASASTSGQGLAA